MRRSGDGASFSVMSVPPVLAVSGLLSRILTTDPSNPASGAIAVLLVAPWLIGTLATVGASIAILGQAAAHHRPLLGVGVAAFAITGAAAAALLAAARRATRGD
jgi:hypothetical protein